MHTVNQLDIMDERNDETCQGKDRQGNQAEPVPPETVQETANEQLADAIADEEQGKRELHLQATHVHHRVSGQPV